MAVPTSAYANRNLTTYNNGVVYHNIGLPLGMTKGQLLYYFYLDELFSTSDGFVGMCEVGGINERKHNLNRYGSINAYTNKHLRCFTDAGLNTLGSIVIMNEDNILTPEGLYVAVQVRPAYYLPTTNYGIGGLYTNQSVPAGADSLLTHVFVGLVDTGQTYAFWGMNQNAEGTYISDTYSYLVPRLARQLAGADSYPSASYQGWVAGYRTTYYQNVGMNNENGLHTFPTGSNKPSEGYYTDGVQWFYLNSEGVFSESGTIGVWPPGDPLYIAPYTEIRYGSYSAPTAGIGSTCNFMSRPDYVPNSENDKIIWKRTSDGKYYGSNVDFNNAYCADGYYYSGAGSSVGITYIQSGEIIGSGDCVNGIAIT